MKTEYDLTLCQYIKNGPISKYFLLNIKQFIFPVQFYLNPLINPQMTFNQTDIQANAFFAAAVLNSSERSRVLQKLKRKTFTE